MLIEFLNPAPFCVVSFAGRQTKTFESRVASFVAVVSISRRSEKTVLASVHQSANHNVNMYSGVASYD